MPGFNGLVLGIDPGLGGATAFINPVGGVTVDDMPTLALIRGGKNKREIDAAMLADRIEFYAKRYDMKAVVEQVWSMPGQGVSAVFAFGRAYGIVIGVLAALDIPVTFVAPQRWKKALQVPAAKDGARARASQLMPSAACNWPLVKHDGRAEAALIAYYGLRELTT